MNKEVLSIHYKIRDNSTGEVNAYNHKNLKPFNEEDQAFLDEMLLLLRTRLQERKANIDPDFKMYQILKAKYEGIE